MEFFNTYLERHLPRSTGPARWYWAVRYLRRVFRQPNLHAVGFKYMYDQVPHSRAVLPYAAVVRGSVVHLVRRNLLDVVISSRLALANHTYHVATDGRPQIPWHRAAPRQWRIELDPGEVLPELQRLARERQNFRTWLRLSRTRSCEVEYETLCSSSSEFGRILAFLGLPAQDAEHLTSGLRKLRSSPQSETITNFAEVERSLAGTVFETHLRA